MTCVLYTGSGSDGVLREVSLYGGAVLAVPLSFSDWYGSQEFDKGDGLGAYRAYSSYCSAAAFTGVKLGGVGDGDGSVLGARVCERLEGQGAAASCVVAEGRCGCCVDGHVGVVRGVEDCGGVCAKAVVAAGEDCVLGGGAVDASRGGAARSVACGGEGAEDGLGALGRGGGPDGAQRSGRRNGGVSGRVSEDVGVHGGPLGERSGESLAGSGLESGVGAKTVANRAKRARAKERKIRRQAAQGRGVQEKKEELVPEWRRGAGSENVEGKRGFFSESTPDMRYALRMSRGERLVAENELKTFQARRRLELEKDKDVNALKKLNEAQLLRRTETSKVQIEKAYASLAASGNVPGVGGSVAGGGTVETVLSASSGSYLTISPGSSVSMKEVHEMQKENLRLKKEREELVGKLKACGIDVDSTKSGGSEKTSWTVDKYGDLLEKYRGDPTLPSTLAMDIDCRMRPDPDGKVEERVAKYYEEMSNAVSELESIF